MTKDNILKKLIKKSKRGGASMFVVAFTTIILTILVLSFTRLILSEATKTTNTDLSQSAYDSALAGIEDAKVALLKYHACIDQGFKSNRTGSNACERIMYYMEEGIRQEDCSTVKNVLSRDATEESEHSVIVQETQTSNDAGNNANMLQSYTCVTIQEDLDDYRTTLNTQNRLRIIPVRSSDLNSVNRINLRWFSDVNSSTVGTSVCPNNFYANGECNGTSQAPTTLTVRLIQTDETFNLSELTASQAADWTDSGQVFLVPGGSETKVTADKWGESANKGDNRPINVNCSGIDWKCNVDLILPKTFNGKDGRSISNTYLLVSIPYGSPETDVSIRNYGDAGLVSFTGVQARIDSTGRANDLYRRVETRVELVDTYFPYPEFEITMTGGKDYSVSKKFWVTFNCWEAENGDTSWCGGDSMVVDDLTSL